MGALVDALASKTSVNIQALCDTLDWEVVMLLLALLPGCGAPDCADGFDLGDDGLCYEAPVDCGDGFERRDDGLCYEVPVEPAPVTLADWLDTLPVCRPLGEGDGRLDLDRGCADGICAGDDVGTAAAVAGEPACDDGDTILTCDWGKGLSVYLYDLSGDGLSDDDLILFVSVEIAYDGLTTDGLGISADMTCFLEAYGEPTGLSVQEDAGWTVTSLDYPQFSVGDSRVNKSGDYAPDGLADSLFLSTSF